MAINEREQLIKYIKKNSVDSKEDLISLSDAALRTWVQLIKSTKKLKKNA
jgi:hypothetical protein